MSNFIIQYKKGQAGKNKGLYMGEGLDAISKAIDGIQRGMMYTIASSPKVGKCLASNELVVMSDYSMKQAKDVVVNDFILGLDGKPNRVINTTTGQSEMYIVKQSNAESYVVNDEHLISLKDRENNIRHVKAKDFNSQLFDIKKTESYGYKQCVPISKKELKVNPYYLGLWLADGSTAQTNIITNIDSEIKDFLQEYASKLNMSCVIKGTRISITKNRDASFLVNSEPFIYAKDASSHIGISESHFNLLLRRGVETHNNFTIEKIGDVQSNPLIENMRSYNLEDNKHIPEDFLYNDEESRLKLLAGFLDGDGHLRNKHKVTFEVIQKNKNLILQVRFLANSLGLNTSLVPKRATLKRKDGSIYETEVFRLIISGDTYRIPTLIKRKQVNKKSRLSNSVLKVESIGIGDYYGFSLENEDKRFFLKDFTVTHNSTFVNYGFVMSPYLYALENPDLDVEWIYYSWEMDRVTMEFDYMVHFLYSDYGIVKIDLPEGVTSDGNNWVYVSSSLLRGQKQDDNGDIILVPDYLFEKIKIVYANRIIPLFGEYNATGQKIKKGKITFIDKGQNPTGIYKDILSFAHGRGTFHYEKYIDNTDKKEKQKLSSYTSNNPNEYVIIIMDTIRKVRQEKGLTSPKQVVDKTIEYITELRNLLNYSFVPIVHLNRDMADIERLKFMGDLIYPQPETIKETGNLSEESTHVFTMFNPNDERYNLNRHFGLIIKDSKRNELFPSLRTVHLVESRYVPYPQHFRVNMNGALKDFKQFKTD